LDYNRVHRLKTARPDLKIILNGGLENLTQDLDHCANLDGLMYGREAYHKPWMLHAVDPLFASASSSLTERRDAVIAMLPYIDSVIAKGQTLHRVTRHMLGLYHGQPGGRIWRQILSQEGCKPGATTEVVMKALAAVEVQAQLMAEKNGGHFLEGPPQVSGYSPSN
jgi:tRNA-dihydrouridine synthase A